MGMDEWLSARVGGSVVQWTGLCERVHGSVGMAERLNVRQLGICSCTVPAIGPRIKHNAGMYEIIIVALTMVDRTRDITEWHC